MESKVKTSVYSLPLQSSVDSKPDKELSFPDALISTVTNLPVFESCILILNNTEGLANDEREELRNHILSTPRLNQDIKELVSNFNSTQDVTGVIGAIRDSISVERHSSYSFQNNNSDREEYRPKTPFGFVTSEDGRSEVSGQAFGQMPFGSRRDIGQDPSKIVGLPECISSGDQQPYAARLAHQSRIETEPSISGRLELVGDTFSRDVTPQTSQIIRLEKKRASQRSSITSRGNYSLGMIDPDDMKNMLHKPFQDKRHNISVLEPQILYTAPQRANSSQLGNLVYLTQQDEPNHERLSDSLDIQIHRRNRSKRKSGIFAKLESQLSQVQQEALEDEEEKKSERKRRQITTEEEQEDQAITPEDLQTQFAVKRDPNDPECFEFETFRKVELEQTLGRAQNAMHFASPTGTSDVPILSLETPDNRQKPARPVLQSTPITSRIDVKPSLLVNVSKSGSRTPDMYNYWTPTGIEHNKLHQRPRAGTPNLIQSSAQKLHQRNKTASAAQESFLKVIKASREYTTNYLESRGTSRSGTPTLSRPSARNSEKQFENRRIVTEGPMGESEMKRDLRAPEIEKRDVMTGKSRIMLVNNLLELEKKPSSRKSSPEKIETKETGSLRKRRVASRQKIEKQLLSSKSKRQKPVIKGLPVNLKGSLENLQSPSPQPKNFRGEAMQASFFTQNSMSVINPGTNDSYVSDQIREITNKLGETAAGKQHVRLFSTTLQNVDLQAGEVAEIESPKKDSSRRPSSRQRVQIVPDQLQDPKEESEIVEVSGNNEAITVRKLESSDSEFTLKQDTDRIKVIPEATDQGSSCKQEIEESKVLVKAEQAIKIIPEAQSWQEDRSMSKEQTDRHNEFTKYTLSILSIATFLRYFSPHDILTAFYHEISPSSSILTKNAFRRVFSRAVMNLSKNQRLREGVELVEKEGFKTAVDWLFDVYTFGPDNRSSNVRGPTQAEGKLIFHQIVPALCILGGGNAQERVSVGFSDANTKKPKLSNSVDQLIGDSNISHQESGISKASSSSKTAIRVDFTTLLNYLTNLFKLLVAASSELVTKLRRGYFGIDKKVTYASLAEACAYHCYEDLDKDKQNGDKISDKAFTEWFLSINGGSHNFGLTQKLRSLQPTYAFQESSSPPRTLKREKDSKEILEEQEKRKSEEKGVKNKLKLNLESLQPNAARNNNEKKSEQILKKSQDLRGTLQKELEERFLEMKRSSQVGEDADGVATFRSSSVDKHKYGMRPLSDLQSTDAAARHSGVSYSRVNYSSQPPSLSPQFYHAREPSDYSGSLASSRSSSSSMPMTDRGMFQNKFYYHSNQIHPQHYYSIPGQPIMVAAPPHLGMPHQIPPQMSQAMQPMHSMGLQGPPPAQIQPSMSQQTFMPAIPMQHMYNSGAYSQRGHQDSIISSSNFYFQGPQHFHQPSTQQPVSRRISLHSYLPSEPISSREGTQDFINTGVQSTGQFIPSQDIYPIETRRSSRYPAVNQQTWDYYAPQPAPVHVSLNPRKLFAEDEHQEEVQQQAKEVKGVGRLTRSNEPRVNNWSSKGLHEHTPQTRFQGERDSTPQDRRSRDNNYLNLPRKTPPSSAVVKQSNNNEELNTHFTPTTFKADQLRNSTHVTRFDKLVKEIGIQRNNIQKAIQSRSSRKQKAPPSELDRELFSNYDSQRRQGRRIPESSVVSSSMSTQKRIQSKSPTALMARDLDDSSTTHYNYTTRRLSTSRASSQISTPCQKSGPNTPHSHLFMSKLHSMAHTPRMQTPT